MKKGCVSRALNSSINMGRYDRSSRHSGRSHAKAKLEPYDAILLDVGLPDMTAGNFVSCFGAGACARGSGA
jgi:DNA-binding response OmpR family regulator